MTLGHLRGTMQDRDSENRRKNSGEFSGTAMMVLHVFFEKPNIL